MATEQLRSRGMPEPEDGGAVAQVQAQVQEKAKDVKGQAVAKTRQQLDTRTSDLGEQVKAVGDALRRSAEHLEDDGKSGPAGIARRAATQADRLGVYLKDSSSDRFLSDIEALARKRPLAAGGIGAIIGLAASRFLKASSEERYTQSARPNPNTSSSRDDASFIPPATPPTAPPRDEGWQ